MNYLKVRDKIIDLSKPKIMGVLNVTPDSFYSGSRTSKAELLKRVEKMILDGCDIIDIGGMSTRPTGGLVAEKEEISRIKGIIASIKSNFAETIISVDTFRSSVAELTADEGADIINDISGFDFDPKILEVVVKYQLAYVLMHSAKLFEELHEQQLSKNVFRDLVIYFSEKISLLKSKNIHDVIIDPGFGFGKSLEHNYEILSRLEEFRILERPILVGLSRKSMITKKLKISSDEALNATTVLNTFSIIKGAKILRVHDVREARQIIELLY